MSETPGLRWMWTEKDAYSTFTKGSHCPGSEYNLAEKAGNVWDYYKCEPLVEDQK